jgi:hypothetical protein
MLLLWLSNCLKSRCQRKVFDSFFYIFAVFFDIFLASFIRIMSGSVLLHRQRSPEDLQQLRAWYKIRDTLLGQNDVKQDIKKRSTLLLFVCTRMLSG